MFIEDFTFLCPHFAHFPIVIVLGLGIGYGHFPAGLGGFAHGGFIIFGVGKVECGE